jgi:hypothetical protein
LSFTLYDKPVEQQENSYAACLGSNFEQTFEFDWHLEVFHKAQPSLQIGRTGAKQYKEKIIS